MGTGVYYGAVLKRGQYLLAPPAFIAACGPALAGTTISAFTNTQPKQGTRRAFWITFFEAWFVSALVCLAYNALINNVPLSPVSIGLFTVAVVPDAFVISGAYSRIPAVRNHLSSLIRLRGVWGRSFLALVLMPALVLLSVPISSLLHRQSITAHQFPDASLALIGLVVVKFLYQLFSFNATGEEAGWRGFARLILDLVGRRDSDDPGRPDVEEVTARSPRG